MSAKSILISFLDFESDEQSIQSFHISIKCTDVQHCEYAASEIRNWIHIKVQSKDFHRIEELSTSASYKCEGDHHQQIQTEAYVKAL